MTLKRLAQALVLCAATLLWSCNGGDGDGGGTSSSIGIWDNSTWDNATWGP